jgi:hypothetical protein
LAGEEHQRAAVDRCAFEGAPLDRVRLKYFPKRRHALLSDENETRRSEYDRPTDVATLVPDVGQCPVA